MVDGHGVFSLSNSADGIGQVFLAQDILRHDHGRNPYLALRIAQDIGEMAYARLADTELDVYKRQQLAYLH